MNAYWIGYAELGRDCYVTQCYFITHLTFIMTGWGATPLIPRSRYLEEILFLQSNMDVVIKLKDPELVGEFLQALRILHTTDEHPSMKKGYQYLLATEKWGSMAGNWMKLSASFKQRYHTAYCGIIGIADFKFDSKVKLEPQFDQFFDH